MRKTLKTSKTSKMMVDSEILFRRLLAVSKQRDVSLELVLGHELAAVPPSLFHDDGTMRKTSKAELANKLEGTQDQVYTVPNTVDHHSAYIIDGMALLQGLNEASFQTFDDLGSVIVEPIRTLLAGRLGIDAVTIVFDRYDKVYSIKQFERDRRAATTGAPSHIINGIRKVPNYRSFMKSSANKAALADFVSNYTVTNAPESLKENKSIILAGGFVDGEMVKIVKKTGVFESPHLFSSLEEANTRIVLHAIDQAKTHNNIIIRCDDTDVLVILLYYCSKGVMGESVITHAGHSAKDVNRQRFIPVSTIVRKLGDEVCQCLPAVHALTGCDTTSALCKIGKPTAYTKLVKNTAAVATLSQTGLPSSVDETLPVARAYALLLYGCTGSRCATLEELRFQYASTTDKLAAVFPHTEDAFKQHFLRVNYQVGVWCHSHLAKPLLWQPVGSGWKRGEDGELEHVMYERDVASIEVRDLIHLYCKDADCSVRRKCHCVKSGLPCTEFCSCLQIDCPNALCSDVMLAEDSDGDN